MLKRNGFLILMIVVVAGLIVAAFNKNKIYDLIGKEVQKGTSEEVKFAAGKYVDQAYNYAKNNKDFEFTLLEFKSSGCSICKQMEPVLEAIKNWDGAKVNVQVIQIMNPDSQALMKFFGIATVPTHIILNNEGKAIYKKYGFISESELKSRLISKQ
jgi:thiol:disulfide interchange protein